MKGPSIKKKGKTMPENPFELREGEGFIKSSRKFGKPFNKKGKK